MTSPLVSGNSLAVLVDKSDLVLSLKGLLRQQFGYQIDAQRLLFEGQELLNDRMLSSYGLKNFATLNLVLRLGKKCLLRVNTSMFPHSYKCNGKVRLRRSYSGLC